MSTIDRATGTITLAFGAFVVVLAVGMPLLTAGVPGPGLLPLIIGLLLVMFGVLLLLQPGQESSASSSLDREAGRRITGTIGAAVLFTAAVPIIGFPIATMIFLTVLIWWWGQYRWWIAGLISLLTSLSLMLVFQSLLHAPLPKGIWG